ncbi:hypothetical protein KFL_000830240 [Klebsormidium nitens]|uniref:Ubiquitin-like-conjugating enzyme ATG10 n=1 Tax=Klebsormidium nitens TaxID=105231 RepID=A0A1Y1HUN8_KLENI|nr:hypothetical protein KFL_000830240 [Klebsormidium nitens]|eukprot:GAQ81542.1 hypothetical protein KFL_000830240 [Klebsormidium nitens]
MAALSPTDFARGARYFVDVWNTFRDEQAEWVEFPLDVAAVHQVSGYVALSNIPAMSATPSEIAAESSMLTGLEEPLDELDEDTATLVFPSTAAAHTYDFHMVYSPAYRVPFLLLRGQRLDGTLLTEEEMAADLPAQTAELVNDGRKWLFLTRQDHPYLNQPWSALHPCETAQMMKLLMGQESIQTSGENEEKTKSGEIRAAKYFLAWFSVAGPVVGLTLPLDAYRFQL